MDAINIPAIRGILGNIVYYTSSFTFKQVADYVKRIDDELHTSTSLKDQLQRTLTENYKSITNYILSQPEHFFNSLVLAVYDGEPVWNEMEVDFKGTDYYTMGFLKLTGKEKIFPVDGQHRVEGIKQAIKDNPELEDETISVILIGHQKSQEGMEKTRRIFSTLNRYAKPVSTGDIIALDEDDTVAIVTRNVLEYFPLFKGENVKYTKNSKTLSDAKAFTNLITLYDTNKIIYSYYRTFIDKNKKVYSASRLAEFLKFRPQQEEIEAFEEHLKNFWGLFCDSFYGMKEYLASESDDSASQFRNNTNGGLLYFRPIGLFQLVTAILETCFRQSLSLESCMSAYSKLEMCISKEPWQQIVWDVNKQTMIMSNKTLIHSLLMFMYDKNILSQKEISEMKRRYAKALNLNDIDDVISILENLHNTYLTT